MEIKYIATPAQLRSALRRAKHLNGSRRSEPPPSDTTSSCDDASSVTPVEGGAAAHPSGHH